MQDQAVAKTIITFAIWLSTMLIVVTGNLVIGQMNHPTTIGSAVTIERGQA